MQPHTKGMGDGLFGGHNCLGNRLETVCLIFSPEDHEMGSCGICTIRQYVQKPSSEEPQTRSRGSSFARLVGKVAHRGSGRKASSHPA